jgi:hypothetical protein
MGTRGRDVIAQCLKKGRGLLYWSKLSFETERWKEGMMETEIK